MALVLWIALNKRNIQDLSDYVDDNFGWDFYKSLKRYEPYNRLFLHDKHVCYDFGMNSVFHMMIPNNYGMSYY
jgi:hypothetical protein